MSCSCYSVQEGSGGVSFSYHVLGVLCPSCEAEMYVADMQQQWDELPEAEKIAIRWSNALWRLNEKLEARRLIKNDPWANCPF